MSHRTDSQSTLVDGLVHDKLGRNARLDKITELVDWDAIGRVLSPLRRGKRGAPPYPALMLFKALLLQQWYTLSDEGLEEALSDRLSFRRFVGLGLSDATPDHSTLWRFREELCKSGLDKAVFSELQEQFDSHGLLVKRGTLLDATVVQAAASSPPKGVSSSDADAKWARNVTTGKSTFGYKAHIAMDQESQLIRAVILTPGNVNDTEVADLLVMGDEGAVYADAAYDKHSRRAALKARGIKPRIMHRPNKHHPKLPHWKQRHNNLISPLRSRVETVFGLWKRHYRWRRVRYWGLKRNTTNLYLLSMASNLRRAEVLMR